MKKIHILAIALTVTSINASAMGGMGGNGDMGHQGPFLGINTMKDMCHMISEDNGFTYMGKSETKLTMNKNFVLATCKGEYIQDQDGEMMVPNGRTQVSTCRIKVQGFHGFFEGTGGFTVDSEDGTVSANCKASR